MNGKGAIMTRPFLSLCFGIAVALAPRPVAVAEDNDKWCFSIDSIEDIDRFEPIQDALNAFARQRAEPPEDLLDSAELASYRKFIALYECQAAQYLLMEPYLRAHPEHACFFRSRLSEASWRIYIAQKRYPELRLCFMEKDFADAVAEMKREGISGRPYTPTQVGPVDGDPRPLRMRDSALFALFSACGFTDYQPACVSYVRIALTTEHIELSDEAAYGMLEIARLLGTDNAETATLRALVAPKLSSQTMTMMREKAQKVAEKIRASRNE